MSGLWQQLQVAEEDLAGITSPLPRSGHAMTYDIARNRVVLFGGRNKTTSNVFNDTWVWDGRFRTVRKCTRIRREWLGLYVD